MQKKVLFFYKNHILVSIKDDCVFFPDVEMDLPQVYFCEHDDCEYYVSTLSDPKIVSSEYSLEHVFLLYEKLDQSLLNVFARALQFNNWYFKTLFCEVCGNELSLKKDEVAKVCPECGYIRYHNPVPAVIVMVKRENTILLVKTKYQRHKFYSHVAGYVDPGETLEECVAREVREEVGIEVKNIRYFGSQAFAPSDAIMIGFTADYLSGEINIDPVEIKEARWFDVNDLPEVPDDKVLAGKLIYSFIKKVCKSC